jgi:simple sugar transport system permease protein
LLTEGLVIAFFVIAIQLAMPILLASLGELVSELGGVLNVGIEGTMLFGALAAAVFTVNAESAGLATAAAVGAGLVCGVILSFLYVRMGTDQIVTGLLFNIFAFGATGLLHGLYLAGQRGVTLRSIEIPVISEIKWVGDVLSQQTIVLYVSLGLTALVWWVMYRTWFGLYARAAGERPLAVEASGLDVWRLRYPAVIAGNVLAALGGAVLVLTTSGGFVPGMTAGRGFIALGVVVLAKWRPWWVVAAALLFGWTQGLQFLAGRIEALEAVPGEVWLALPYMVTVIAVVFAAGSRYPGAVGLPYKRPRRTPGG